MSSGLTWSKREEALLRKLWPSVPGMEIARQIGRTRSAVASRAKVLKLHKNVDAPYAKRPWTKKEDALLRGIYPHFSTPKLIKQFGRSIGPIYRRAYLLGITKSPAYLQRKSEDEANRLREFGVSGRFQKGLVPFNKGLRRPGWAPGRMAQTQFKKGQQPRNTMPLWSFRWYSGGSDQPPGYLVLKTGKPGLKPLDGWEFVHKLVWEEVHGLIPNGYRIWWKDKDHANNALTNLELLSGQEHMARTTVQNLPKPIKTVIQLRGALNRKIRRLTHGEEHAQGSTGSSIRDARGPEGTSRQEGRR